MIAATRKKSDVNLASASIQRETLQRKTSELDKRLNNSLKAQDDDLPSTEATRLIVENIRSLLRELIVIRTIHYFLFYGIEADTSQERSYFSTLLK